MRTLGKDCRQENAEHQNDDDRGVRKPQVIKTDGDTRCQRLTDESDCKVGSNAAADRTSDERAK